MARTQDKHGKDHFLPGYELSGLESLRTLLHLRTACEKLRVLQPEPQQQRTSPDKIFNWRWISVNNERGCGWEGNFLSKPVVAHFPQQPSDTCRHEIHKITNTEAPQAGATDSCAKECRLPNQVTPVGCREHTPHPPILWRLHKSPITPTSKEMISGNKNRHKLWIDI